MRSLVIYLIGINVLTFLIYGIDKWKAIRGKWRIPGSGPGEHPDDACRWCSCGDYQPSCHRPERLRKQVSALCTWMADNGLQDVPLHFSRFFPRYRFTDVGPTPKPTLLKAREVALSHGIRTVHLGNM